MTEPTTDPVTGSQEGRGLPVRMLGDRVLVTQEGEPGERRSGGGIVIPATAAVGKRLSWATVVAVGMVVPSHTGASSLSVSYDGFE